MDTTVLTDLLLKRGAEIGKWSRDAVKNFDEILLPVYALKEFSSGPLNYWILLYNKFALTKSFDSTLLAIASMSAYKPRYGRTALEAISMCNNAEPLVGIGDSGRAEFYRSLLLGKILRAWKRRRMVEENVTIVDELHCFAEGDPLLKPSDKTLNNQACRCNLRSKQECCASLSIKNKPEDIKKLITAMVSLSRREDVKRRDVLHKMVNTPKSKLDALECRSIGDAYFAIQSPQDATILTTNGKDHQLLAGALGKKVRCPQDTSANS